MGQSKQDNTDKPAAYGTPDEDKQRKKNDAICVGHRYAQANTNNVDRTCTILHTTGGKDESNIIFMWKS